MPPSGGVGHDGRFSRSGVVAAAFTAIAVLVGGCSSGARHSQAGSITTTTAAATVAQGNPPSGPASLTPGLVNVRQVTNGLYSLHNVKLGGTTLKTLPPGAYIHLGTRTPADLPSPCGKSFALTPSQNQASAWVSYALGEGMAVDERIIPYPNAESADAALARVPQQALKCTSFLVATNGASVNGAEVNLPPAIPKGADDAVNVRFVFNSPQVSSAKSQLDVFVVRKGRYLVQLDALYTSGTLPITAPLFIRGALQQAHTLAA
jgi:hypothetical protein